MMLPRKLIFIEGTISRQLPDENRKSGIYYLSSWGGLFARRLKQNYPELDLEIWTAEPGVVRPLVTKELGVDCRVFPDGLHVCPVLTPAMLRELYRLQHKHRLVLYRSSIFDWKFNFLLSFLFPKAIIIISHHGGCVPSDRTWKEKISRKLREWSLRKVTAATYLRKEIKDWIKGVSPSTKLMFLPVGADFSAFTPLDKQRCRLELGLDPRKTYAVYVGKFYRLKGVDIILDLLTEVRGQDFEVLFAGGSEGDELMEGVKSSGCKHWGYINWELLRKIYSAADFYIHPAFHPHFGGLDVTLMESLACGTPVVSPQLLEFDFDTSELGIAVRIRDDFRDKFLEMLREYKSYTRCREVARQHLDGNDAIIAKLNSILTHS